MSKAFTTQSAAAPDDDEDVESGVIALPAGAKNYITPRGYADLQAELKQLAEVERPKLVETVSWAAKNGDRSENGDYLYGKKRLREIDRRLRHLIKRLDMAAVTDPSAHHGSDQVFFGATVTVEDAMGVQRTVTIKGVDESDPLKGEVSWVSPIARALLKARRGDEIRLSTPAGAQTLEVVDVSYPSPGAE